MADTIEGPQGTVPKRKRSTVHRVVRTAGWTSIGLGLFILGFVAQQLFVTTYFAQQANNGLTEQAVASFKEVEIVEVPYEAPPIVTPGVPDVVVDPEDPVPTLLVEAAPDVGQPFAIIRIPSIERLQDGWAVVEGVSRRTLRSGAGHMPRTPLPGQPGNAVISGHRTTYGAPFHELDQLQPGDVIEVETAVGVHIYEVTETVIVKPRDLWVTEDRGGSTLTLTTCHPKFSARQRLVVFAELVDGPNAEAILGA
jgi:sortase A